MYFTSEVPFRITNVAPSLHPLLALVNDVSLFLAMVASGAGALGVVSGGGVRGNRRGCPCCMGAPGAVLMGLPFLFGHPGAPALPGDELV